MGDQIDRKRGSVDWAHIAALLLLVGAGLFLRMWFVYAKCFPGDFVNFQGTDPWYHVRAIENLIHNFPHRIALDPYALQPGGQHVAVAPLFDLMVAGVALVLGAGSPSTQLTHTVCAWFPAVLGALITLPAYLLGRSLGGPRTGLLTAAIIAVMPGAMLKASLLGYTDHHVAECMFSLLTVGFLIRALQQIHPRRNTRAPSFLPGQGGMKESFPRARSETAPVPCERATDCPPDAVIDTPWRDVSLRAMPAGFFLGCYLLTWVGGSLLVLALFVAIVVHILSAHFRGQTVTRCCVVGVVMCFVALVMVIPFRSVPGFEHHIVSLIGMAVALLLSEALARYFRSRSHPRLGFVLALAAVAAVGIVVAQLALGQRFDELIVALQRFVRNEASWQTVEAASLLTATSPLSLLWAMFGSNGIVAAAGLVVLVATAIRRTSAVATILVVLTVLVGVATLQQRRFSVYLALCAAILAGYVWGLLLDSVFKWKNGATCGRRSLRRSAGVLCFIAMGLTPSVWLALPVAELHTGPAKEYHDALVWLRENTPEPFGDASAYDARLDALPPEDPGVTPPVGYGVMCWWDYGYWIAQIARRPPTANPTQAGAEASARFFTAQNEAAANQIMEQRRAKYLVVDASLSIWPQPESSDLYGKLANILRWAGQDSADYFETYFARSSDGSYKPITLFYPKFYRSMLARLLIFSGEAYAAEGTTWCVQFSHTQDTLGNSVKRVENRVRFVSFEAATRFVEEQDDSNWRIVGNSFARSCVPLQSLERYRLVYKSPTVVARTEAGGVPTIAIFEFLDSRR